MSKKEGTHKAITTDKSSPKTLASLGNSIGYLVGIIALFVLIGLPLKDKFFSGQRNTSNKSSSSDAQLKTSSNLNQLKPEETKTSTSTATTNSGSKVCADRKVPYKTVTQSVSYLTKGQKSVIYEGFEGTQHYCTYGNGVEVVESGVLPVDRVEAIGTAEPSPSVPICNETKKAQFTASRDYSISQAITNHNQSAMLNSEAYYTYGSITYEAMLAGNANLLAQKETNISNAENEYQQNLASINC